jgi:hypothetical protein
MTLHLRFPQLLSKKSESNYGHQSHKAELFTNAHLAETQQVIQISLVQPPELQLKLHQLKVH